MIVLCSVTGLLTVQYSYGKQSYWLMEWFSTETLHSGLINPQLGRLAMLTEHETNQSRIFGSVRINIAKNLI